MDLKLLQDFTSFLCYSLECGCGSRGDVREAAPLIFLARNGILELPKGPCPRHC